MISLRQRIARRIGLVVATALLVGSVALGLQASSNASSLADDRALSIARVMSAAVAGPLSADNSPAVRSVIAAGRSDPAIRAVRLWSPARTLIASEGPRETLPGATLRDFSAGPERTVGSSIAGVPLVEGWAPVILAGRRLGTIEVAVDRRELTGMLWSIWLGVAAVVLIGTSLATFVAAGVAESIARPIRRLAGASASIAEGDLTLDLGEDASGVEEVASLTKDFRVLIGTFRELIEQALAVGADLEKAGEQLLERAEGEASAATEQAASLAETSATLQQLLSTTRSIAQGSVSVAELATTVQHTIATGLNAVRVAHGSMEEIRAASQQSAERAEELQDAARRIVEVVGIIHEIARRTKILAVNASIEAARARELGAGFNVVASEVGQLADSVVDSTNQIEETMDDLAEAIRGIVRATELQEQRVSEGAMHIDEAEEAMRGVESEAAQSAVAAQEISFGTQQQQEGAEQVSVTVREVAEVAGQLAETARLNRDAAGTLSERTSRILWIVKRFTIR